MSSEQFQLTHESIHSIGTRLLQYLSEIRQSRLNQGRETRESEKMEICAILEAQKVKLNEYLNELAPLRVSLDNSKPKQIPIMLG
jgi:hypothetical protein